MSKPTVPLRLPFVKSARAERLTNPLPTFWNVRGRFYGERIDCLPSWYVAKALDWPCLRPDLRAALLAVSGLRQLSADQEAGL